MVLRCGRLYLRMTYKYFLSLLLRTTHLPFVVVNHWTSHLQDIYFLSIRTNWCLTVIHGGDTYSAQLCFVFAVLVKILRKLAVGPELDQKALWEQNTFWKGKDFFFIMCFHNSILSLLIWFAEIGCHVTEGYVAFSNGCNINLRNLQFLLPAYRVE